MATIRDLRTIGNQTIYIVDAPPAAGAGTEAFVGSLAMFDGFAEAEVSSVTFSQLGSFYDVAGSGLAIQLYDGANAGHYFWFSVSDGANYPQTDPALVGTGHEVVLLAADASTGVATKFASAVDGLAGFVAPAPAASVVAVTNAVGGGATDATATGSAAVVAVTAQGIDAGSIGHLYLKVGAADVEWNEIANNGSYINTGDYRKLAIYSTNASGVAVDDTIFQNGKAIDIIIASQAGRTTAIEYTVPNPGNAITAASFVLTEGAQTINGDKTFGDNVIIQKDLTVNGALTYINTTNLQVTDKLITLNKGGAASSAFGSGIEFEENSLITGYLTVNTAEDGFLLKAPAAAGYGEFLFTNLTANRSYTWQNRNGYVALQASATGVTGQIPWYNGSYLLDCETGSGANSLYWDSVNNRLGVGNVAPARALDVTGSSVLRGALLVNDGNASYEIMQATIPTTAATVTPIQSITIGAGEVYLIEARVIGKRTGGVAGAAGDCAAYIRTFRAKLVAGVATIFHYDSMYTSEDQTVWDVKAVANGAAVDISVKGAVDNNVTWDITTIVQLL